MKRRKLKKRKRQSNSEVEVQNEYLYFIAGYTSSGLPFGITWREAYEEVYVDDDNEPIETDIDDDELPF